MKPVDLDELERLRAAATPGPYHIDCNQEIAYGSPIDMRESYPIIECEHEYDEAFVLALLNAFPAMRDELRTRRKQVEVAKQYLEIITRAHGGKHVIDAKSAIEYLASLESGEPRHE